MLRLTILTIATLTLCVWAYVDESTRYSSLMFAIIGVSGIADRIRRGDLAVGRDRG